jgi:hypothetical protein
MAWNSIWSARFCSDRRVLTRSHGILKFRPSRMMRWYLPKTVTTPTVAWGTVRNSDRTRYSARNSSTMESVEIGKPGMIGASPRGRQVIERA